MLITKYEQKDLGDEIWITIALFAAHGRKKHLHKLAKKPFMAEILECTTD